MDRPKVSVIIPVYNCEPCVGKCLESLTHQTLKDIEIICVDDGSSDASPDIIRKYCEADKRVTLVETRNNLKQGAARNRGMEIARGEYIGFVDADDWVDLDFYEKLYNTAKKYDSDIALADYVRIGNGRTKIRLNIHDEKCCTDLDGKFGVCKQAKHPSPANKIYRTEFLKSKGLVFPEGVYCEDKIFVCKAVYYANSVVSVPGTYYYYFRRPHSTVKTKSKAGDVDKQNANRKVLEFLRSENVNLAVNDFWAVKKSYNFFGVNIYTIKESLKTEKHFLFGFLPLKEICINKPAKQKKQNWLLFKDIDSHYVVQLFGLLQIRFKHKVKFDYADAVEYGLTKEKRNPQLIVSLTSFPGRIDKADRAINTIFNQSLKPDRVILWLAQDQFPNREKDLSEKLLRLMDLGLEIRWCEDLLSYKKIIPALKEFPNDIIVTADDDLYYERDWLKSLYEEYLKDTSCIYVRRATRITLKGNRINRLSGRKLAFITPTDFSYYNQLMSGSGCLFPPNSLNADIFNVKKVLSNLPTQDDIFIWAMAVLNRTKIKIVKGYEASLYYVENTQQDGLCKINKEGGSGISPRQAYRKISELYPELINILQNS